MSDRRIMVVNFTRMGDLIQSGPFLRTVRMAHPDTHLTMMVFTGFADVARRMPMVDDVIVFDVDRWVPMLDGRSGDMSSAYRDAAAFFGDARLANVDLLYNLSHTPQSATLCALMRPRRAHGRIRLDDGQIIVRGEWFNYLLSVIDERTLNPFNLAEIYLRAGRSRGARALEFRVAEEDRRTASHLLVKAGIPPDARYVVLQPGASSASRQWPPAHFARLASLLHAERLHPVIVGSREEVPVAQNIVSLSHGQAVSLAGYTDVGALAAVLEGAHLLVSNDTGTIHLAAAVGTRTIGIYLGPASAKDTAPFSGGHLILEPDVSCAPCGYRDSCQSFTCHRLVTVDHVFRLCMADPRNVEITARSLSGVRVFRTQVDIQDEFSLQLLNDPAACPDFALLNFYRNFWDGLLSARPAKAAMSTRLVETRPEWRPGVESLRGILESAERRLFALLEEASKPVRDARRMSDLLHGRSTLQSDLRRHAESFPLLAPFSRYLLVRLLSVRSNALREHLEDLRALLETFEKAVAALTASASLPTARWRPHAATV
jgi:ADP-heptose:LPS heptosyltransferase